MIAQQPARIGQFEGSDFSSTAWSFSTMELMCEVRLRGGGGGGNVHRLLCWQSVAELWMHFATCSLARHEGTCLQIGMFSPYTDSP